MSIQTCARSWWLVASSPTCSKFQSNAAALKLPRSAGDQLVIDGDGKIAGRREDSFSQGGASAGEGTVDSSSELHGAKANNAAILIIAGICFW